MPLTQKNTRYVLFTTTVILVVYEILTLSFGQNATISETVWNLTPDNPLIVLAAGILVGHFWFVKRKCVNCGKSPWRKS